MEEGAATNVEPFRLGTLTTWLRLASDTAASSDTPWNSGSIHPVLVGT